MVKNNIYPKLFAILNAKMIEAVFKYKPFLEWGVDKFEHADAK